MMSSLCRYEEDYERLQAMNELLEVEEAPLPQAALQQWLQKLDVGWNKLLEMWGEQERSSGPGSYLPSVPERRQTGGVLPQ